MKCIGAYLEEDGIKWREKPYLHVKKNGIFQMYTFGQVTEDIKNLAKALILRGWKDQMMAIYGGNSYEWMVLNLAIMGYVGTCVPIDKEWTQYDLTHVMKTLPIKAVFSDANRKENVEGAAAAASDQVQIFTMEEIAALIRQGEESEIALQPIEDPETIAEIMFTSGTTDIPKRIPLTQHNLLNNWETLYARTPMTEADRSYLFLPLNHVYAGIANFLYTIISGMEIYLCSDITLFAQEMMEVKPTIMCMVPLLLYRMYEQHQVLAAKGDNRIMDCLRQIRFLYCGGSFTNPEVKEFFIKEGVNLLEAYGTSETASVIAIEKPGDPDRTSNGVIFENLSVKVLDPDEEGVGEILVAGGSRTAGYLNAEDNDQYFDTEGYYHTGDLGRVDAQGHLYLKGRKRRMIITANGKNVYVDEMEKLLMEYEEVNKAKVYEEEHDITTQIYTNAGEERIREIVALVNEKLPKYKKIRRIHCKEDVVGSRLK